MKTPILGQAYVARSPIFAADRMINLYPEQAPTDGKESGALIRCPGLVSNAFSISGEVRGGWTASNGNAYVVIANKVFRLQSGVLTVLGTLPTKTGAVIFRDNGIQVAFVDGFFGYIITLATDVFAKITDIDFPNGATHIAYVDTYFIAALPGSQDFFISGQNNGTTWGALDFFAAEGSPDNIVAIIENHRELWCFGAKTTEPFSNSGDATFTFQRVTMIQQGCAAKYSVAKMDNAIFWIGQDDNGSNMVYRSSGYTAQRVSTHAIEFAMGVYSQIDDAIAYCYQEEGHSYYVITFPTANATWAFDMATSAWHERASHSDGAFSRHRSNCHIFYDGKHLVGDYENGKIYQMKLGIYSDDGQPQKWLRSWRQPNIENKDIRFPRLEIDCERGVGLDGGVPGSDPVMMLRYSNDGGLSFGNERWAKMWPIGIRDKRTRFMKLGHARDRVWELSGTDPVKVVIVGAYTPAVPGNG